MQEFGSFKEGERRSAPDGDAATTCPLYFTRHHSVRHSLGLFAGEASSRKEAKLIL